MSNAISFFKITMKNEILTWVAGDGLFTVDWGLREDWTGLG